MRENTTPLTFENNGEEFGGLRLAENWLRQNGYAYGSMERGNPIGVAKDAEYISKWRGMTEEERKALDGRIESTDFRNGTVFVYLKEKPCLTSAQ